MSTVVPGSVSESLLLPSATEQKSSMGKQKIIEILCTPQSEPPVSPFPLLGALGKGKPESSL